MPLAPNEVHYLKKLEGEYQKNLQKQSSKIAQPNPRGV